MRLNLIKATSHKTHSITTRNDWRLYMYHNKNLTVLSQKLRKEMTKEEKKLWYQFLRHYPTQFKRQVTCGDYILDFYCPSAKLAIELDGYYHGVTKIAESDKIRTEYLNSRGVQVLRFPNRDVWNDFERVCNQIDFSVHKRCENKDSAED